MHKYRGQPHLVDKSNRAWKEIEARVSIRGNTVYTSVIQYHQVCPFFVPFSVMLHTATRLQIHLF